MPRKKKHKKQKNEEKTDVVKLALKVFKYEYEMSTIFKRSKISGGLSDEDASNVRRLQKSKQDCQALIEACGYTLDAARQKAMKRNQDQKIQQQRTVNSKKRRFKPKPPKSKDGRGVGVYTFGPSKKVWR